MFQFWNFCSRINVIIPESVWNENTRFNSLVHNVVQERFLCVTQSYVWSIFRAIQSPTKIMRITHYSSHRISLKRLEVMWIKHFSMYETYSPENFLFVWFRFLGRLNGSEYVSNIWLRNTKKLPHKQSVSFNWSPRRRSQGVIEWTKGPLFLLPSI